MSEASAAWLVHWVLLKGMLWVLGIPGAVPFLELAAYAGYAFVPVCISMLAGLALGALPVTNRSAGKGLSVQPSAPNLAGCVQAFTFTRASCDVPSFETGGLFPERLSTLL